LLFQFRQHFHECWYFTRCGYFNARKDFTIRLIFTGRKDFTIRLFFTGCKDFTIRLFFISRKDFLIRLIFTDRKLLYLFFSAYISEYLSTFLLSVRQYSKLAQLFQAFRFKIV
jgi:hypothetical protein